MRFSDFAIYLHQLEQTPSRLEMTSQLAKLYQALDTQEIKIASYLMQGRLVPAYQSLEFNLSVKMVIRALARLQTTPSQTTNHSQTLNLFGDQDFSHREADITKIYKAKGDVGLVAEELLGERASQPTTNLDITAVFTDLTAIAKDSGKDSQQRKIAGLVTLLEKLNALSARYVVRVVIGKLRLGFSTMTMIDALSWAVTGDKSESELLETAYNKKADVGELAEGYLALKDKNQQQRAAALTQTQVQVGVPVMPALCQRLNSAAEIVDKMGQVYAEPKYDGLRVQIHVKGSDQLAAYTRNLDNIVHMFPELEDAHSRLTCKDCILDAEAIGYHAQTGKLLPFQETITRRRKHQVETQAQAVPIRFYVFDLLELDGEDLTNQPLRQRKELLKKLFSSNEVFFHTPFIASDQASEIQTFHQQQLGDGLEGAVMKQIDGHYISGRKGWSWVKIKEAEGSKGKLADTLDCIVMGYYFGRGKRTAFGIGAVLVGVLAEDDSVVTIAKIGTGLSDEQLKEMKQRCDASAIDSKPKQYQAHKDLHPDVWVTPQLVVEIAADEITKSPNHTAKVALRFPRLVQFRDDKGASQATTTAEVTTLAQSK